MSQQINLFDPVLLAQKKIFSAVTMAQALAVIVVGGLLFYGYAWYQVRTLQNQVERTGKMLDALQARVDKVQAVVASRKKSKLLEDEVARMENLVKRRQEIVAELQKGDFGNRQGFSAYFGALARQKPEGLWLTDFMIAGAGDRIAISGRTLQPELVPVYITRLAREPAMEGKTFADLSMTQPKPAADAKEPVPNYVDFTLRSENLSSDEAGQDGPKGAP